MAQPTATDVHVDGLMADIAIRFKNMRYIGDRLFPMVRVKKKSDKYVIFRKGAWFRDEADMHKGAIRFGPGFAFRLKGTLGSPRTPQEASWF